MVKSWSVVFVMVAAATTVAGFTVCSEQDITGQDRGWRGQTGHNGTGQGAVGVDGSGARPTARKECPAAPHASSCHEHRGLIPES